MLLNHIDIPAAEPGGAPFLIAHGLFGSARNWGALSKRYARGRRVVAVDMRNHGDSPHDPAHDYPAMAADLADTIEHVGAPAAVMGHSMGGKAAMTLALTRPDLVERLIVADIAPVAYGHSQSLMIDAMRRIDPGAVDKRSDADAELAKHVSEAPVRAFLLQSLDLKERRWRLNLDVLDDEMHRITGWPDPPGVSDNRALFLTGGASDYVTPDARPAVRAHFPRARFARIPGAGHWLHAEKPREFEAAVATFLEAAPAGG